jgi:hypothetical protein
MYTKTKIALAVAMVLGAASAALAYNEHDDSVSETEASRQVGNPLPWWWNSPPTGRAAFAYAPGAFAHQPAKTHHNPTAAQRAAPIPSVSREAYAEFAQGGAYVQTCSHSGGPKNGSWTCR